MQIYVNTAQMVRLRSVGTNLNENFPILPSADRCQLDATVFKAVNMVFAPPPPQQKKSNYASSGTKYM